MAGTISSKQPLRRFFSLLSSDKSEVTYIYIYAIFNGLVALSLPLGIQAIVNLIMGGQVSTSWMILVIFVVLGIAITGGLQILQLYLTEVIQQRIFLRASFEFAYRIPRFKFSSLQNKYPPELINRFFDTNAVQKGLSKILLDFSTSALQIIFGLILLSFYHPFFVFFSIILLSLIFIIFRVTGPMGLKTSLKESSHKYEVAHWLEELARTNSTFKLAGFTNLPLTKNNGITSSYIDARKSHFRILVSQYASIIVFKLLITGGLLILGSILVMDQEINIGQFVAAEIVILTVISSVEKLILSMEGVYDILTAVEKIGHVTDIPIEEETGLDYNKVDQGKGMHIKLNKVHFKYPGMSNDVLKNITFEAKPNEKICITGYNASGKTTLLNTLAGFYEEVLGEISYNGIPLKNFFICSLRAQIGDVLSHEQLFNGTIEENISMGRPNVSFERVQEAATAVGLSPFIQDLPNGYDTMINPEGRSIPRSVSLKMLIARSIADKPRLLLFEEFMHNLERQERIRLTNLLTDKNQPWTLIAVSNDPIFAQQCDKVIVLRDGEVLAQGTYEEIKNMECHIELFSN